MTAALASHECFCIMNRYKGYIFLESEFLLLMMTSRYQHDSILLRLNLGKCSNRGLSSRNRCCLKDIAAVVPPADLVDDTAHF